MKKKKFVTAVAIGSLLLGVTTASASTPPQHILNWKALDNNDGLYRYCDNHNLIYIYREFGGMTSSSFQVAITSIAKGC